MSKRTDPSLIPLFGSRIPIPGKLRPEPVTIIAPSIVGPSAKSYREITRRDVGKKVRVAEKEGVLRFVGSVHFAQGVWCGIELPNANGKNDGCVRGVRYFACPESRGLMVRLCNVLLGDDCVYEEEKEDAPSGPHSMLFGITEFPKIDEKAHKNIEESAKRKREGETSSSKVLIKSNTYETLEGPKITVSSPKALIRSGTYDKPEEEIERRSLNSTASLEEHPTFTVVNLTYLNESTFSDTVIPTRILENSSINDSTLENNVSSNNIDDNNETFSLNRTTRNNNLDVDTKSFCGSFDETIIPNKTLVNSEIHSKSSGNSANNTVIVVADNKVERSTSTVADAEAKRSNVSASQTHGDCQLNETIVKNFNNAFEKYKTKPFKYSAEEFTSSNQNPLNHPIRGTASDPDVESSPRRRIRASPALFSPALEEEGAKRYSLDSLGILTPEQMGDVSFAGSRTPSLEIIDSLRDDLQSYTSKFQAASKPFTELGSPNVVDVSIQDLSLGILDENVLLNFSMKSDDIMNMELHLDSVSNQSKNYMVTGLEQTPSPEELPLDPTPVIGSESKTEPTNNKSKTSSFITSITSIMSLDTGYQGDGEMSRPASRGPDHSPLTRRPIQRPPPRRPDPMTDSDFYTESDADNHEEHPQRGGRLARVIDGTLYGVDPQTAADIYVNNRENMDSSGIFTDIEGNTRADELSSADTETHNDHPDVSPSPSDTSSKTISNDSQNNAPVVVNRTDKFEQNVNNNKIQSQERMDVVPIEGSGGKRKSPSPSSAASSPASVRSPRHTPRDDNAAKKYKAPKRNVASKVKAALESNKQQNNKEVSRTEKTVGRWDAVMNKISKSTPNEKTNLKEIKSKVFAKHISVPPVCQNATQKTTSNKVRRTRTRADVTPSKTNRIESLNSSASDLSGASPAKRIGSTKKRAEVVRVTQVLTAAKLSPRGTHKNVTAAESKKNATPPITTNDVKSAPRRTIFSSKDKKQTTAAPTKDCGRATVKGGRASPGARPPQQTRALVAPAPRTVEALGILVQHLVFNLEAFQTPILKKQLERSRLALVQAQLDHTRKVEEERVQHKKEITEQLHQLAELKRILSERENERQQLIISHNDQLLKLRAECNKLQKTHEQTVEILQEENDSVREDIDKLDRDYKAKELSYKEQLNVVNLELSRLKEENMRIMSFASERKENKLQIVLADVDSLRAVLELKQNEIADLRKALAEANQKRELLPTLLEKVSALTARCEDLQSQLEQKVIFEHQLLSDNKKLQESFKEELNHSKRLLQHNEELQWKLKQNKEVVTRVLEQAEETAFNRSLLTSSFNERHNPAKHLERTLSFRERSLSHKGYNNSDGSNKSRKSKNSYDFNSEDISPPNSPKVKGVVEKSDSVSYVLEMEESPELIANRIVRRSFRNSTPPKTTPTKSPVNKRPRIKNNRLSLSASASAIIPNINRSDNNRCRFASERNADIDSKLDPSYNMFMWHLSNASTPAKQFSASTGNIDENTLRITDTNMKLEHNIDLDDYNDDDIKLPALPSEIGQKNDAQSLPVPKHLAAEAIFSESNSEDESSTSSSSSGQL